jgi:hypothetical protein
MRIATLDVVPQLSAEQLESLRHQLLTAARVGTRIKNNTLITCEGQVKALLLKGELPEAHYRPALKALELMRFNSIKCSRRGAVKLSKTGSDLLMGWIDIGGAKDEDILRAGNRDFFFLAMRLVPLLRDMEAAMEQYLPDYWKFHLEQAMRVVRPDKTLKTLNKVADPHQRKMLEQWNNTDYYHFMGTRAFSTLTLNHNITFGAHDDRRNVPGTLSCLTALGQYAGGTLCFPRLGVSFDLQPRDLLIADTNTEFHGTVGELFGSRYSIVAYLHGSLLPRGYVVSQLGT